MPKRIKVNAGDRFGRWTVVKEVGPAKNRGRRFECLCDCGETSEVQLTHLRQGASKSCGCLHREISRQTSTKHGYSRNPIYSVWAGMMRRCYNKSHQRFKDWGGRGISVCMEWHSVGGFIRWAEGHGYRSGLSIDRIDNDGNYCPKNCRWVTTKEQNYNRSDNKLITHNGITRTQSQWAESIGIHPVTLAQRLKRWSIAKALTTPPDMRYSHKQRSI